MEIKQRLFALRKEMEKERIDYYIIPSSDPHMSEYLCDYYKIRQCFSGFTGSNGTLLVGKDVAILWTDGRYFIQAEQELEDTSILLYKSLEPGVPTIRQYLTHSLKENNVLGINGCLITAAETNRYETLVKEKKASLNLDFDLSEKIWKERPQLPHNQVYSIGEEIAGVSVEEKIQWLRTELEKTKTDAIFLNKLDQIMWLFNLRGSDIYCNPVAFSYAYISKNEVRLWLQEEADKSNMQIKNVPVSYCNYNEILEDARKIAEKLKENKEAILLEESTMNGALFDILSEANYRNESSPIEKKKAVKNEVELANMRKLYLKDSVAVTKFIYWLQTKIKTETITEMDAADYIDDLRREIPEFEMLSFPTISAYLEHAAMMHYEATKESAYEIKQEGILLVDSGGQYLGATTDVTRSIVLGSLSEEVTKHYSAVTAGMLSLMNSVFLKGCTGRNLDILARSPIWKLGLDYKCGTGHGVGCMLNVHEGPHSIRYYYVENGKETRLEEGMVVTDEPGVYVEGSHGIRIENVLVVKKIEETKDGIFLGFENLTWVPIDKMGVSRQFITEEAWNYYKAYQQEVYIKIAPYLTEKEALWLKEITTV